MAIREVNNVTFGNMFMWDGIIPCIELTFGDDTHYLSAFRDYCFQVSNTIDGGYAMGDTQVFGLETFSSIEQRGRSNISNEETCYLFIGALAQLAVNRACQYAGLVDREKVWIAPDCNPMNFKANDELIKFVKSCYNRYVKKDNNLNKVFPNYVPK